MGKPLREGRDDLSQPPGTKLSKRKKKNTKGVQTGRGRDGAGRGKNTLCIRDKMVRSSPVYHPRTSKGEKTSKVRYGGNQ